MMRTDKQNISRNATDHLAGMIAQQIILTQSVIAGKLNRLINRCSPRRKKWLLLLFSTLFAAGIIVSLFTDDHYFTGQKDTEQPRVTHIGQASGLPEPKRTDPLTLKK